MVIKYKIEATGFRPVSGQVDMSIQPCRALEVMTLRALPGTTIPGNESHSKTLDARVAGIPPEASKEFDLGQRAVKTNDFAEAIPHLQKAIALYPRYAEAYQLLGVAQLQTGHGQQAETSLVKALEIEDRMPQVQYLLGVVYAKTNRADLAEKPLNRFADLDPQNPDAHFELAKVSFALKKYADAEMHARKAIELKEANTGVYAVLGYALLRQNKPKAGRQAFQQFLKLEPNSPMAPDLRAAIDLIDSRSNR
jgi:Flp pilus assembly protein TadD